MLNTSFQPPPAKPPILSAMPRTASWPTGIQVGFGSPWPCFEVSVRRPSSPASVKQVIELSRVCMTSAMIVCSDQCRMLRLRSSVTGWRAASPSQRERPGPPAAVGEHRW